jgi:hypothetical protein
MAHLGALEVPVQGGKVVFLGRRPGVGEVPQDTPLTVSELAERRSPPSEAKGVPQEGHTCVARMERLDKWNPGFAFIALAHAYGLLYVGTSGQFLVTFTVSNRQGLSREYPYRFSRQIVGGLLVIPFSWLNFFTSTENEAFQAVFKQFLFDVQRDRMPAAEKPGGS